MTTNTKSKKPKTPAESLRNMKHDIVAEAAADWRRWAVALADDEGAPDGRELMAVAAALQIQDPVNELRAAADAIIEVRVANRGAAACEQALAEMLAPFGGDYQKLNAAVEAAKAEVDRLKDIAYTVYNQCNIFHYRSMVHQARMRHKWLWPGYHDTGKVAEL
jgi:hypothetical protein